MELEKKIEEITKLAIDRLGPNATPDLVKKVVNDVIEKTGIKNEMKNNNQTVSDYKSNTNNKHFQFDFNKKNSRIIITAIGKDRPGIVASLTQVLGEYRFNIKDITQSILQDFFTMIVIVDTIDATLSLDELQSKLAELGKKLNIKIIAQHEDVFEYMHRI